MLQGETGLSKVRFWAAEGSIHPETFVPAEVVPLPDTDISIGHSRLLLHKNNNKQELFFNALFGESKTNLKSHM